MKLITDLLLHIFFSRVRYIFSKIKIDELTSNMKTFEYGNQIKMKMIGL